MDRRQILEKNKLIYNVTEKSRYILSKSGNWKTPEEKSKHIFKALADYVPDWPSRSTISILNIKHDVEEG